MMEAIVSPNPVTKTLLFLPTTKSFYQLIRKSPIFFQFSRQKTRRCRLENPVLCGTYVEQVASSSCYGGWEELEPLEYSTTWKELEPVRHFMTSIGIRDGKSAVLFCLGFLSALTFSRVRFSKMIVLPVSILVFAAGLSVGVTQSGFVAGPFGENGRRYKDVKFFDERLKVLIGFMGNLDIKLVELEHGLEKIVTLDRVQTSEIKSNLNFLESLRLESLPAKKAIEDLVEMNNLSNGVEGFEVELDKKSNQKSSKRKKDANMASFDFLQFIVGYFQESRSGSKAAKIKETVKREAPEKLNTLEGDRDNNVIRDGNLAEKERERTSHVLFKNKVVSSQVDELPEEFIDRKSDNSEELSERLIIKKQGKIDSVKLDDEDEIPLGTSKMKGNQSYYNLDNYDDNFTSFKEIQGIINRSFNVRSRKKTLEEIFLKQKRYKEETLNLRNNQQEKDFSETDVKSRDKKSQVQILSEFESSVQIQSNVDIRRRMDLYHKKFQVSQVSSGFSLSKDSPSDDRNNLGDPQSRPNVDGKDITSNSTTNNLDKFTQNLHHGAELLKQARECLRNEADKEMAEILLYKCTDLLSAAVSLKPMSLLAVGQLGNTLLLHGELKLKISREMRNLLSGNDFLEAEENYRQHFDISDIFISKEKVVSVLDDVCEECEDLLHEAGRNYRMALSIDGSDIRSLYNWGLTLYFRAELISDIGPSAASEADKIYLASIDKFAAMASKSSIHTSDALFRWGLALQQRSNLRQGNSKQKVKLLQQAKSLFEEVLSSDSNNRPVREALFSCLSEIEYNKY